MKMMRHLCSFLAVLLLAHGILVPTAPANPVTGPTVTGGAAYAWGLGASGQLGNNATAASSVPVAVDMTGVLAGKTVTAIAAGSGHSLALTSDGKVFAWGSGSNGQLGNNAMADSSVPVAVDMTGVLAGKTVTAIAAGSGHSLALTSDGKVFAWGSGTSSQLGNNATADSSVPVAVDTTGVLAGKTVTAIAAGSGHSLALTSDGKVFAWGSG
ncbi:MAG: cell wall anchor protein, partial [Proteobacteria bacterium]|nr:cell wall anchor protein [Pseudomonadota bacterium]